MSRANTCCGEPLGRSAPIRPSDGTKLTRRRAAITRAHQLRSLASCPASALCIVPRRSRSSFVTPSLNLTRVDSIYSTAEPIAIVGMSTLFPGSVHRQAFWRNIVAGRDSSPTSRRTTG